MTLLEGLDEGGGEREREGGRDNIGNMSKKASQFSSLSTFSNVTLPFSPTLALSLSTRGCNTSGVLPLCHTTSTVLSTNAESGTSMDDSVYTQQKNTFTFDPNPLECERACYEHARICI